MLVENALLTPVAIILPAERKSCKDTTTRPRKGAGTTSDWYVLEQTYQLQPWRISYTIGRVRNVDFYKANRDVNNNATDDKLDVTSRPRLDTSRRNLDYTVSQNQLVEIIMKWD